MRYFKREWNETRGDQFDAWGTSIWHLEIADDLSVCRQIETYANGITLKYDADHVEDEFGGLGEGTLDLEGEGFLPFEIGAAEFERAWAQPGALNRPARGS